MHLLLAQKGTVTDSDEGVLRSHAECGFSSFRGTKDEPGIQSRDIPGLDSGSASHPGMTLRAGW